MDVFIYFSCLSHWLVPLLPVAATAGAASFLTSLLEWANAHRLIPKNGRSNHAYVINLQMSDFYWYCKEDNSSPFLRQAHLPTRTKGWHLSEEHNRIINTFSDTTVQQLTALNLHNKYAVCCYLNWDRIVNVKYKISAINYIIIIILNTLIINTKNDNDCNRTHSCPQHHCR